MSSRRDFLAAVLTVNELWLARYCGEPVLLAMIAEAAQFARRAHLPPPCAHRRGTTGDHRDPADARRFIHCTRCDDCGALL